MRKEHDGLLAYNNMNVRDYAGLERHIYMYDLCDGKRTIIYIYILRRLTLAGWLTPSHRIYLGYSYINRSKGYSAFTASLQLNNVEFNVRLTSW